MVIKNHEHVVKQNERLLKLLINNVVNKFIKAIKGEITALQTYTTHFSLPYLPSQHWSYPPISVWFHLGFPCVVYPAKMLYISWLRLICSHLSYEGLLWTTLLMTNTWGHCHSYKWRYKMFNLETLQCSLLRQNAIAYYLLYWESFK